MKWDEKETVDDMFTLADITDFYELTLHSVLLHAEIA